MRTVLFPPNSHLPGSLLRSGFCFVVPRKVNQRSERCHVKNLLHHLHSALFTPFCIWSSSVYSGHQSILIPPFELESCLPLWLSTLSQYRIRDTFCSYSVMELCTKGLGTQTELLKVGWEVYLDLSVQIMNHSLIKTKCVTFGCFEKKNSIHHTLWKSYQEIWIVCLIFWEW